MTDQERAERVFNVPGVMVLAAHSDRALDAIAAEFAAVRLDERRAIVTLLREASFVACADVLVALADRIERGEHEARS